MNSFDTWFWRVTSTTLWIAILYVLYQARPQADEIKISTSTAAVACDGPSQLVELRLSETDTEYYFVNAEGDRCE